MHQLSAFLPAASGVIPYAAVCFSCAVQILLLLTEMSKKFMSKSDKVLELRPCCHPRIMTLCMKVIGNNNYCSLLANTM